MDKKFSVEMFRTNLFKIVDDEYWVQIKKAFPIMGEDFSLDSEVNHSEEEFEKTVELVKTIQVTKFVQRYFIIKLEKYVRKLVVPEFYAKLSDPENNGFFQAVSFLHEHYLKLIKPVTEMYTLSRRNGFDLATKRYADPEDFVRSKITGSLYCHYKDIHGPIISAFYKYNLMLEDNANISSLKCPICHVEDCRNCTELLMECNRKLNRMKNLAIITEQPLTDMSYQYVDARIQEICDGELKESHIQALEKWIQEVIIKWLSKMYLLQEDNEEDMKMFSLFKRKLTEYLHYSYTKQRINQVFKIIIEYPDSLPVLQDIKECLPKTDLHPEFTRVLKSEMKNRLLHPGVGTSDILTAYVATIRALRVLDPSGQLLDCVTEPIHDYLRTRSDTVRCVVTSLTEDGPNDLAEELVSVEAAQPQEEDEDDWMSWVPPPKNPIPNESTTKSKSADIITMLINVYGSKELFVNEYRTLLADRLLSQLTCDTEKEIRYLELLKLRFGDSQLNYCEVMLKDIIDSKRLNQRIKENPTNDPEENFISAMIVSAQFWPPFKDDRLELHPKVVKQMQSFTGSFEALKGDRTLLWKNHLGVVDLEIETGSRTLELSVSPLHAVIILYFQDTKEWSLKRLSKKMMVPITTLRRKITYWQSQGLISEVKPDVYVLGEDNLERGHVEEEVEDYETESVMASTKDQRNEELQTFWSYIVGMLTNLETLSLDRIHQMLKMFVFEGPTTEYSMEELQNFLDKKIREHQLILSNGVYKLPK